MYLGIDIGGTKTLVASLTNEGVISESVKFPTPKVYTEFLKELSRTVASLSTDEFRLAGVAAPGRIDRERGVALAFGNLKWHDVPLRRDIHRIVKCPVVVDNDANLAGLSEAMLIRQYDTVLYVTISTGIGTGVISNQQIDPNFADSEGGEIVLEHKGKIQKWEDFASGRAIVKRFGKRASDIDDQATWKIISKDIAIGLFDLITFIQPDAVVLGGGVCTHLDRFDKLLLDELKRYETPITPIPPILKAQRPEEAVVYGCFDLAKATYEASTR
ncbi:MAG TPA: ROK family protein [Candidatus Saccharimonadales bacterium]|nr:ROK family protein [Candidatus Saccharimonadales bacterium]